MTAKDKRKLVIVQAKPAIGRNYYSQNATKRECVFAPYALNGRYYSDCSSFVRWLYRKAAIGLNNIGGNTVGIIASKLGVEIECGIKSGVPTLISNLRVGDVFLFRGSDKSRSGSRYVGHVEIVSAISGNKVTLMGHGSGRPKTHSMKTYCRYRWALKVSSPIGNRGLICVKRFIPDDPENPPTMLVSGDDGDYVKAMQETLLSLGFRLEKYGADGDYGAETAAAVSAFQESRGLDSTGQADEVTYALIMGKAIGTEEPKQSGLRVIGGSVNVRSGPGVLYKSIDIARKGDVLTPNGLETGSWVGITHNGSDAWITKKYVEVLD